MNCQTSQSMIEQLAGGSLPPKGHSDLQGHLATCESCRKVHFETGALIRTLAKIPQVEPPFDLHQRVMGWVLLASQTEKVRPRPLVPAIYISMGAFATLVTAAVLIGDRGQIGLLFEGFGKLVDFIEGTWKLNFIYAFLSPLFSGKLAALAQGAEVAGFTIALAATLLGLRHFLASPPSPNPITHKF